MSSDSAYVKQLLAGLEAALALHRPEYLDELAPGLTDEELEELFDHFRQQMAERRLLIWGTGCENLWHVHVEQGCTSARGYRSAIGPISSTKGRLLLTNYESLTMAAAYSNVTLPQPHDADQLLTLAPGDYNCRVVQSKDPDLFDEDAVEESKASVIPDFRIELQFATKLAPVWTAVPWWNSGGY